MLLEREKRERASPFYPSLAKRLFVISHKTAKGKYGNIYYFFFLSFLSRSVFYFFIFFHLGRFDESICNRVMYEFNTLETEPYFLFPIFKWALLAEIVKLI